MVLRVPAGLNSSKNRRSLGRLGSLATAIPARAMDGLAT
jgi:hypothetical protein